MADYLPTRLKRLAIVAEAMVLALVLTCCGKPANKNVVVVSMPRRAVGGIVHTLEGLTNEANKQTIADTDLLVDAVDKFLASPDDATRMSLQQAWMNAHTAFAATRALLIADHKDLLFQIDAWPIEPGFLDSLSQYPESGIINDFTLTIDKRTLLTQNGITDNAEVCLGFHPLEYYAFARPIEDFVAVKTKTLQAKIIDRRRHALMLIATMLDSAVKRLAGDMKQDLAAYAPRNATDSASDDRLVRQIIAGSHSLAHAQLQEVNLIVTGNAGDGGFSGSSLATLAREVATERQIYASEGGMLAILKGVDATTTSNLDTTLTRLSAALATGKLSANERAKLPLMFSALSHQFSDLERHLPKPAQ